jgi:hypothetical protein
MFAQEVLPDPGNDQVFRGQLVDSPEDARPGRIEDLERIAAEANAEGKEIAEAEAEDDPRGQAPANGLIPDRRYGRYELEFGTCFSLVHGAPLFHWKQVCATG